MPIIDKDYVEEKKGIKKDDPVKITYFEQEPELGFYVGFGRLFNISNNGDLRGILPSDIKDVDKLGIVKTKSRR